MTTPINLGESLNDALDAYRTAQDAMVQEAMSIKAEDSPAPSGGEPPAMGVS